jgi:hypothetical protein
MHLNACCILELVVKTNATRVAVFGRV